jgi:hypothetical protein
MGCAMTGSLPACTTSGLLNNKEILRDEGVARIGSDKGEGMKDLLMVLILAVISIGFFVIICAIIAM